GPGGFRPFEGPDANRTALRRHVRSSGAPGPPGAATPNRWPKAPRPTQPGTRQPRRLLCRHCSVRLRVARGGRAVRPPPTPSGRGAAGTTRPRVRTPTHWRPPPRLERSSQPPPLAGRLVRDDEPLPPGLQARTRKERLQTDDAAPGQRRDRFDRAPARG